MEEHDRTPASVRSEAGDDAPERISRDDWFDSFDEQRLTFLDQDQKAGGEDRTFFELIRPLNTAVDDGFSWLTRRSLTSVNRAPTVRGGESGRRSRRCG